MKECDYIIGDNRVFFEPETFSKVDAVMRDPKKLKKMNKGLTAREAKNKKQSAIIPLKSIIRNINLVTRSL